MAFVYPEVTISAVDYDSFSTVASADSYFAARLDASAWTSATADNKAKALRTATLFLDRQRWQGDKTDAAPAPRGWCTSWWACGWAVRAATSRGAHTAPTRRPSWTSATATTATSRSRRSWGSSSSVWTWRLWWPTPSRGGPSPRLPSPRSATPAAT